MSTLKTTNLKTLDDALNIPLTSIALKSELNAATISVVPTGGITQTNVQAALANLDTRVLASQPLDATLTALAGVTTSANTLIYATGVDAFTTTPLTPFARTILDDPDAATVRTTLGTTALVVSGTVNSTSGTSVDFTSIPVGVKRITLAFNAVSSAADTTFQVQMGAGAVEVTGYNSCSSRVSTGSTGTTSISTGFTLGLYTAAEFFSGSVTFINTTGNIWVQSGVTASSTAVVSPVAGVKTFSGVPDRVRVTTTTGTTLDAGAITLIYEG